MMTDYNAPAELYTGRNEGSGQDGRYQTFPSLAEAVRYTIEDLSLDLQHDSVLDSEQVRYEGDAIRGLYFAEDYPLRRAFRRNARPEASS
jgi:hypothetical protein